jgi:hypothetical protein
MTVRPSWVTNLESIQWHFPRPNLALQRNKDRVE